MRSMRGGTDVRNPWMKAKKTAMPDKELGGQAEGEQVGLRNQGGEDAQCDVGKEQQNEERGCEPEGNVEEVAHPFQQQRPAGRKEAAPKRDDLKRLCERLEKHMVAV